MPIVVPKHKLRCGAESREPGGGGINVARVADRLGGTVRAVALTGGPTGRQLTELAEAEGLEVVPVEVGGETRLSFSVIESTTGRQFRFVLPGPTVDDSIVGVLLALLTGMDDGSSRPVLVISGSCPPGMSAGALRELIDGLHFADVVVDTSGPPLIEAARSRALMIKPNVRELAGIVGRPLVEPPDIATAAADLLSHSPLRAVLVSLGKDGALLIESDRPPVRLGAPTVQLVSAVGAGDSLVGGLAVGLADGDDLVTASARGVAAGAAAVLTEGSGLCHRSDVVRLTPQVVVEQHHP